MTKYNNLIMIYTNACLENSKYRLTIFIHPVKTIAVWQYIMEYISDQNRIRNH